MNDYLCSKPYATPLLVASLAFGSAALSGPACAMARPSSANDTLSPDVINAKGVIHIDSYSFDLASLAPEHIARLTDSGLFGPDFVGMTLFSPSAVTMGGLLEPGSFKFAPSEPGTYSIYLAAKASKPNDLDLREVNASQMPETYNWTMLLVGLGMVGSRLQRKETVPARMSKSIALSEPCVH